MSALCVADRIIPGVGYNWCGGVRAHVSTGMVDRSRPPVASLARTKPDDKAAVRAGRALHPTWDGHKPRHWLRAYSYLFPSKSTITAILDGRSRLSISIAASGCSGCLRTAGR